MGGKHRRRLFGQVPHFTAAAIKQKLLKERNLWYQYGYDPRTRIWFSEMHRQHNEHIVKDQE